MKFFYVSSVNSALAGKFDGFRCCFNVSFVSFFQYSLSLRLCHGSKNRNNHHSHLSFRTNAIIQKADSHTLFIEIECIEPDEGGNGALFWPTVSSP